MVEGPFSFSATETWTFKTSDMAVTGSWSDMSSHVQVPAMAYHHGIWTGSEVIFWGWEGGGIYSPGSDLWSFVPTGWAPLSRNESSAVWTGSSMIVWGGRDENGNPLGSGGVYDPVANRWSVIETPILTGARATHGHLAVWTGTEQWRKSASAWEPYVSTPISSFQTSPFRTAHSFSAHWTGDRLYVLAKRSAEGAWFYDPALDRWQPANVTNAPFLAKGSSTLWAGDRFIHWGGITNGSPGKEGKYYLP